MILLIEIQYFPPVIAYSALIKCNKAEFSIYENYRRHSFRNRCIIAGANGPISLTVPVAGGRNQKKIVADVLIDNSVDWQQQHWRSIFSAYGKSPWFIHYADSLKKLFSQKPEKLVEWNRLCLDWVNQVFGFKMRLLESPGLLESQGPLEGSSRQENYYLDWRDLILPANFQDSQLGPFPVYTQVFEERFGFQPNLSILDFVLCCGKSQVEKLLG
jgi:hypothetical protein